MTNPTDTLTPDRIEVLTLEPDDIVIVTLPEHTTPEVLHDFQEFFTDKFGGHKVIVKTTGIDIEVVRP